MFAYCENNPVMGVDYNGECIDTFWDVLSLCSSAAEVIANPADPWAWASLAGDIVDVVVPGVSGVGEAVSAVSDLKKASKAAKKLASGVDNIADGAKATKHAGGLCFVEGTLVHTETGNIPIEEIEIGNLVWAWDEETGEVALKEVVETYVNETNELVHVHVNGEEIICTPSHPFYSPVKGWTEAVHLRAGDILVLVNGEYVVVEKIQHELLEAPIAVYNFQVEGYHTYYVSDAGVLVHNSCKQELVAGSKDSWNARVSVNGMNDHNPPHAHIFFKNQKLASVTETGEFIAESFGKQRRSGISFVKDNLSVIADGIRKWWMK